MPDVAEPKPLTVKEAARVATAYLLDLLGQSEVTEVRLEEVERTPDSGFWLVTVGYSRVPTDLAGQSPSLVTLLRGGRLPREYKVLKVDARSGEVESMKIRQP